MAEGESAALAESGTVPMTVEQLAERFSIIEANLTEKITELEYELEERGWDRLLGQTATEFSRDGLRKIARESLIFYMKNPLIRRAVDLSTSYIFGQGFTVTGDDPIVDAVVQELMADEKNRAEFSTPLSLAARDVELRIWGNLFFVFFTNEAGQVRVRSIPFEEVQDVIFNPDDNKEPWYYLRNVAHVDASSGVAVTSYAEVLHPDWQYTPPTRPATYGGKQIDWAHPVYHVKVNAVGTQRFGLSEIYSAQDWARSYNEFLANWATITRALARFAWKVVTAGGANQRAAAKAKLDSAISTGGYNPAPSTGSVFIETDGASSLQPVRTAGSTTSPSDGRRLLLMVCSATGFPETFFGDASVGTLATAKSLDRPTELQFLVRQRLHTEILENIMTFAIEARARAGNVDGLSGVDMTDTWGETYFSFLPSGVPDPITGEVSEDPISVHVDVSWPDLVERDVVARVGAVVQAATLGGAGVFAGTLTPEYVTKQLLIALGEKSVEEVLDEIFPYDEEVPEEPAPEEEEQHDEPEVPDAPPEDEIAPEEDAPEIESLRRTSRALKSTMREFLTILQTATVKEPPDA